MKVADDGLVGLGTGLFLSTVSIPCSSDSWQSSCWLHTWHRQNPLGVGLRGRRGLRSRGGLLRRAAGIFRDDQALAGLQRRMRRKAVGPLDRDRRNAVRLHGGEGVLVLGEEEGGLSLWGRVGADVALATRLAASSAVPPTKEMPPFVLDISSSAVAANKIQLLRRTGAPVLPGMLADEDGTPIMDSRPVPEQTRLLPFGATREMGSHKGYGMALIPFVGSILINILEILVGFIQAFVFVFLTTLFLGQLVVHVMGLGVEPITGKPYKPTTQGKNERFHQTLFRYLDKQPLADTLAELQAQVDAFDHIYNTQRPHQGLPGRITPRAAWEATPKADPPRPKPDFLPVAISGRLMSFASYW